MPFTGGFSPGPEQYGGSNSGVPGSSAPLLQRIYESLCSAHGSAYAQDFPPKTPFGIEMLAYARAITYDLFGANQRLANQFLPTSMTADGLLPRWEKILGQPAQPGDTEPMRRARMVAAFARLASPNTHQPVVDALSAVLGPLFSGVISYQSPNTALAYWPGAGNNTSTLPWWSSIDQINVQLSVPPAYISTASGAPNAAWWAAVGAAHQFLGDMLPAWITWTFYILSSHGTACFYLDEPDLSLEVFC